MPYQLLHRKNAKQGWKTAHLRSHQEAGKKTQPSHKGNLYVTLVMPTRGLHSIGMSNLHLTQSIIVEIGNPN